MHVDSVIVMTPMMTHPPCPSACAVCCVQEPFGEHVAVHTFGFGRGHSTKLLQVREGGGQVDVRGGREPEGRGERGREHTVPN